LAQSLGGINGTNLRNFTLQIEGDLYALADFDSWPHDDTSYNHFLLFVNCSELSVTGSGLVDGVVACTENVLVENMVMTGFGASIGSVPPHPDVNCVRNITMRNVSMPETGKGIDVKSNPECDDNTKRGVIDDFMLCGPALEHGMV